MAVAILDAPAGGNGSDTLSYSVSAGDNRLLVIMCTSTNSGGGKIPTAVTYGGESCVKQVEESGLGISQWTADEAAIAAASGTTISVTWTANNYKSIMAGSYEGVLQAAPGPVRDTESVASQAETIRGVEGGFVTSHGGQRQTTNATANVGASSDLTERDNQTVDVDGGNDDHTTIYSDAATTDSSTMDGSWIWVSTAGHYQATTMMQLVPDNWKEVTFDAAGSGTSGSGGGTSETAATSGAADDAFVIVIFTCQANSTPSTPSGWTAGGGGQKHKWFYRQFVGAASDATSTFGDSRHGHAWASYLGVDQFEITAGNSTSYGTETPDAGAMPLAGAWVAIVGDMVAATTAQDPDIPTPSAWTTRRSETGYSMPKLISDIIEPDDELSAGTGATMSPSSTAAYGILALRPASGQVVTAPYVNPQNIYAPQINLEFPNAFLNPASIYAPTLGYTLTFPFVQPTSIYTPDLLARYITAPYIQPTSIYAPQIDFTLPLGAFIQPTSIYAPEVRYVVSPPFLQPTSIYAPAFSNLSVVVEFTQAAESALEFTLSGEAVLEFPLSAEAVLEFTLPFG